MEKEHGLSSFLVLVVVLVLVMSINMKKLKKWMPQMLKIQLKIIAHKATRKIANLSSLAILFLKDLKERERVARPAVMHPQHLNRERKSKQTRTNQPNQTRVLMNGVINCKKIQKGIITNRDLSQGMIERLEEIGLPVAGGCRPR